MTADSLAALEYIRIDQTCELQQREKSWLAGGEDEESEEDLEWLEELQEDKRDNETYFSFINESRQIITAGSQAFNCYGSRSNKYLMISYNFCFLDNYFDTFLFQVKLDVALAACKVTDFLHNVLMDKQQSVNY